MPYMLIRHKVTNFATWKPAFDAHLSARQEMGSTGAQLLQSADDPNEVLILMTIDDVAKARAFAASETLQQAMQKAGVADRPDILFLNEVEKLKA